MSGYSSRYHRSSLNYAQLTPTRGGLALDCTYDSGLVADLKARIPADGRRWDPARKRWLVAPQYADLVAGLCADESARTGRRRTRMAPTARTVLCVRASGRN